MIERNKRSDARNWIWVTIGWTVALFVLLAMGYKLMFRKQAVLTVNCLDQATTSQRASTPLLSVEKYAACLAWKTAGTATSGAGPAAAPVHPVRCPYAGTWNATRDNMVYEVTLDVNGKFSAEPGDSAPPRSPTITGAWTVAGNVMIWAYDSGPVWPPDINPISAQSDKGFTLTEVNGSTTRYTLIERAASESCVKK